MTLETKIKIWLYIFLTCLVLVGLSVFPIQQELELLDMYLGKGTTTEVYFPELSEWISKVNLGFVDTYTNYPFMVYGLDWLGFAHIILGILFIGPIKDPVRNIWVIEFGIIACLLIIPFAIVLGHYREIPFFSRLIDCTFGVIGIIPLLIVRNYVKKLESRAH